MNGDGELTNFHMIVEENDRPNKSKFHIYLKLNSNININTSISIIPTLLNEIK